MNQHKKELPSHNTKKSDPIQAPNEPIRPTTLEEAQLGGGGEEFDPSPLGDEVGTNSTEPGGGGGEEAEADGDGARPDRLLRSAMTTTTKDSFLRQLSLLPLMK